MAQVTQVPSMKCYKFSPKEVKTIREELLSWYEKNKRDLPWRTANKHVINDHAYAVWVSEIMLQQTQVSVVMDYYNRWMTKWPDAKSLALASEEDVNQMWSGLGYYSRGRRLLQGAKKVVHEMNGNIPDNADSLMKELPGVGRYTAAAISSIAFNEAVGVLDGNVTRVLCRMRTIGRNSASGRVISHLWCLTNTIVDPDSPGNFNQALMELGATVCTPKNPKCSSCPVSSVCNALKEVKDHAKRSKQILNCNYNVKTEHKINDSDEDIEDCSNYLRLPSDDVWDIKLGVENYPRKQKKKLPRVEKVAVTVIECAEDQVQMNAADAKFLLFQRPKHGLLAGLWEFPSKVVKESPTVSIVSAKKKRKRSSENCILDSSNEGRKLVETFTDEIILPLKNDFKIIYRKYIGQVPHIFSHIHQINHIEHVKVKCTNFQDVLVSKKQNYQWVSEADLKHVAKSSAVNKILVLVNTSNVSANSKSCTSKENGAKRKQSSIVSFFRTKNE